MRSYTSAATAGERIAVVIGTIILSTLFVALTAQAVTTISTNISTDGNLTVSGNSTFGDGATDVGLFTGTLQASTTALFTSGVTTYGDSTFGDTAGDVNLFTGTLQASTTALFTSGFTTYGNWVVDRAATTTVTFPTTDQGGLNFDSNTLVIDPQTNRVGIGSAAPNTTLEVVGTASSTALVVRGGTSVGKIVFGVCGIAATTVAATSSATATCTDATGVEVGDRIFVQSTSTPNGFIITAASSTAINTIDITFFNAGQGGAEITSTGDTSVGFWAVQ